MTTLRTISDVLLIAGGLNWGTIALSNGKINPVDKITGGHTLAKNIIYGAIGTAALVVIADDLKHGFHGTARDTKF